MERGTYPTLWQWNGKVYLTHLMSAKWKEVPYATLWQWNGKVYLNHFMSPKWKEVLTQPCGTEMERVYLTQPCGS